MDVNEIAGIAGAFKIRCSAILDICGGEIGLTDKQQETYDGYIKRINDPSAKPLTPKMNDELERFQYKLTNPELPDGAKTYCKKWLKEYLWHRRKDVKSKYIDKGNANEEDGFTLMCLELNLGMVYKNTQYHSNEYMQGTDDLFVREVVYDNKCAWDLDTFPIFDEEIPKADYEWQLNGYCELRGVEDGVLAYTLVDADPDIIEREVKWLNNPNDIYKRLCEMIYTTAYFNMMKERFCPTAEFDYFVEIPQADRIKTFPVKKDPAKIAKVKERVPMCRAFITKILTDRYIKN